MSKEFKKQMDAHEAFYNEYNEFMENYDRSDLDSLTEYTELLQKYSEYMKEMDDIDEESISVDDYAYYFEVQAIILKKLESANLGQ